MIYLANAFSLKMLPKRLMPAHVHVYEMSLAEAKKAISTAGEWTSAVGHADTAAVIGEQLGVEVPCNRINVSLGEGDMLIVAQLYGDRLPEGVTKLPENSNIEYLLVKVIYRCRPKK